MTERQPCAIVTGGSSGIGRATCERLARDGWRVAVADLDGAGAEAVAAAIGGTAYRCDVGDEASVLALFDAALDAFGGRLDGLATPAGVVDTTPWDDIALASFDRCYRVNVVGTYLCIREAGKHMRRGGRICTVSSVAGKLGGGLTGTAAYAASKGAVIALTRNAARALAPRGIAVNGVAPGPTMTGMLATGPYTLPEHRRRVEAMTLLGRTGEPPEIAAAIAWLLSPRSSFVLGETLTVDGGVVTD